MKSPDVDAKTMELNDFEIAENLIKKIQPNECYHLAGSSFVDYSKDNEDSILNNNVLFFLNFSKLSTLSLAHITQDSQYINS